MIHSLTLTAMPRPGWPHASVEEALRHYLVTNAALGTQVHRRTKKGWATRLPRHRFNILSGNLSEGIPDMMIGKAELSPDGTFTATLDIEWALLEHWLPNEVFNAAIHRKGELNAYGSVTRTLAKLDELEDDLAALLQIRADTDGSSDRDLLNAERRVSWAGRRLNKAIARCKTTNDIEEHHVLRSGVDWGLISALAEARDTGISPYLVTPPQITLVALNYLKLLFRCLQFLDPQTLQVESLTVYFQWAIPDLVDLFPVLRQNIVNKLSGKKQYVDVTDATAIHVREAGFLKACSLYSIPARVGSAGDQILRLMVNVSPSDNRSRGLVSVAATGENQAIDFNLLTNWAGIVGLLEEHISHLPLVAHTNDLERLLQNSSARKAAALSHHPDARQLLISSRSRRSKLLAGIEGHPTVYNTPPTLEVPPASALINADPDDLKLVWPSSPDS